jgi:hypothetical protein
MRSNRPQIASLSALLYCPIGSTENRSLRHVRFFVTNLVPSDLSGQTDSPVFASQRAVNHRTHRGRILDPSRKSPARTVLPLYKLRSLRTILRTTIFDPSHSIFWPARNDTQPNSMISVRRAAISIRE